jgi:hypothetical protein
VSQLKNLDRTRNAVLKKAKKSMKREWRKQHPIVSKKDGDSINTELPINDDAALKVRHGYFGAPFSYYGSAKGLERGEVRDVYYKDNADNGFGLYGDL